MRSLLLSLLVLPYSKPTFAASNDNAVIAGVAAGAIAGGIAAAAIIHQVKEQLEYKAIQHVLLNMPELTKFELKHFGWEAKKWSDLSNTTNIPFIVRPKGGEPFILLMVTSHGWIDQSAIYHNRIHFEKLDRDRWNSFTSAYLSAAGFVEVTNAESIPGFIRNPNRSLTEKIAANGRKVLKVNKTRWGNMTSFSIADVDEISGSGLSLWVDAARIYFPFQKLKGDEYRVRDVDQNTRIIYNEKSMGIFFKHSTDLVQFKSTMIKRISSAVMVGKDEMSN